MTAAPREHARRILRAIDQELRLPTAAKGWAWPERVEDRVAELVGDAQEEVRTGFLEALKRRKKGTEGG